jgi:hypothetical protein
VRTLIEGPGFEAQLAVLGGTEFADRVLSGITWGIATYAEAFDLVPGFQDLRIAKTDEFEDANLTIVPLRIYFKILNADEVLLFWVERADQPGLLESED